MAKADENSHGQGDAGGVETPAPATGEESNRTVVSVSTPGPDDDDEEREEHEEIGRLAGRLEALEQRIAEAVEGERTWTKKTITSLQQEVADLKATLKAASENLPPQIAELREELTRLSQELQQKMEEQPPQEANLAAVAVVPPQAPSDENKAPAPQSEGQGSTGNPPEAPKKRSRRVI